MPLLSLGLSKCEMAQAMGNYSLLPADLRIDLADAVTTKQCRTDPEDTVTTKQCRTKCEKKKSIFFIMMVYSQMAAHWYPQDDK
jgi:hypothetical protein